MTIDEHVLAARKFLAAQQMLIESEMDMAAAEVVWGAAIQAIDAAKHRSGEGHAGNNRDRSELVESFESTMGLSGLSDGLKLSINRLHNHFYTGRLSQLELTLYVEAGVAFVVQMLEIAGTDLTEP